MCVCVCLCVTHVHTYIYMHIHAYIFQMREYVAMLQETCDAARQKAEEDPLDAVVSCVCVFICTYCVYVSMSRAKKRGKIQVCFRIRTYMASRCIYEQIHVYICINMYIFINAYMYMYTCTHIYTYRT